MNVGGGCSGGEAGPHPSLVGSFFGNDLTLDPHMTHTRDMTTNRTAAPVTARQLAFLRTLCTERVVPANVDTEVLETLTASQASNLIGVLLQAPRRAAEVAEAPAVAAGRYAVELDGRLGFFVVDHGKGRWAGRVFVRQQASDETYPVRGQRAGQVLAAIEADPMAALVRYGHELGVCGVCGRTLTDEESRARGIGPVCADRL